MVVTMTAYYMSVLRYDATFDDYQDIKSSCNDGGDVAWWWWWRWWDDFDDDYYLSWWSYLNLVDTADSDNQQQQRRRAVNNSPLRSSFTASATNSGGNTPAPAQGVTSRRYPMGAPLATIHHDHDSTNTTGASSTGSNKPRSSTPTKAWKF